MRDLVEFFQHWQTGRSERALARSLGLGRNTIAKYVAVATAAGLQPGTTHFSSREWAAFVQAQWPHLAGQAPPSDADVAIARWHAEIVAALPTTHPSTIWQRLHDEQKLAVSLSSFYRYLKRTWPEGYRPTTITVLRDDPPPGQEAQIDFGYLGTWTDASSRRHRLWVFTLVLAFSRHMFVRVVLHLDQTTWLECHVAAFAFLGAVPRRLVIDNLGSGVLTPDLYDPALNRSYQQLADHYGTLIDPCRVGHPKDKPRVERMIPYVRDSFWTGRTFGSMDEINGAALIWCREVAGQRIHGTTRQRPFVVFTASEAATLLALPTQPFELATWERAKVHADCHIHVRGALYSIPHRHVGQTLDVRLSAQRVQFFRDGELIKTHTRVPKGQRQTHGTDYPPEKAAFYAHTPDWCRHQADTQGPAVRAVVEELLGSHALQYLRQCQGIVRLAEKYGAERLNAACQRALDFGDPAYRTIQTILIQGLDAHPVALPLPASGPPAYLRGVDGLFAHAHNSHSVTEGQDAHR